MKILTGNDLGSGAVTWWDGKGWSLFVDDAVDAGEDADEILARETAARRVNVPYAIEASIDAAAMSGLRISRTGCAHSARPCGAILPCQPPTRPAGIG